MHDTGRETLLAGLRAEPRRRVAFEALQRIATPLWRRSRSSQGLEGWLRAALDALAASGAIRLPVARHLWRPTRPPLPEWVQVIDERTEREPLASIREGEHWLPRMAFARSLHDRSQLERARTINRYLKSRPALKPALPLRERSLEIFGDEKELERCRLQDGRLFGGKLPLSAIGAFPVPLPIPYERAPHRSARERILVVENAHSFHSLVRWNDRAGRYAAIAYGSGNALSGASATGTETAESYLDIILERTGAEGIDYLGDLDPRGIRIPAEIDRARRTSGRPGLRPAQHLYTWLLANGHRAKGLRGDTQATRVLAREWLGAELASGVEALFDTGCRIAQESLTYRDLLALDPAAC